MKTVTSGCGLSHGWLRRMGEQAVNLQNVASGFVISSCIVHELLHMQSFFAKTFFQGQSDRSQSHEGSEATSAAEYRMALGPRVLSRRDRSTIRRSVEDGTDDV